MFQKLGYLYIAVKQIYLYLIFIFAAVSVYAQTPHSFYFQNLNINNGLSQNTVNAILQDKHGFMWFGTKDGLNRYDGLSVKTFKGNGEKSNELNNGFVTSLYEDCDGNMWVGTDVGVYIYNPYNEHFEHFTLKAQNGEVINRTVYKIGAGNNNEILFSVDKLGLFVYDRHSKKLYNHDFEKMGNVKEFQTDSNGVIWLAFASGLYYTENDFGTLNEYMQKDGSKPFRNELIKSIHFGDFNRMYIGSEINGVFELNLVTGYIKKLHLSDNPSELIFVRCLYPYSDKELWIGTETGVHIYNMESGVSNHLVNNVFDSFSLSDNAIYSLYKDREGGMWIGSYFGGVNYYPKQTTYFEKYYSTKNAHSLQGQRVREICEDKNGNLWVGTEDSGLFSFDRQTKEFKQFGTSRNFSNIHGLCMDGDDLWVGTFSKGLRVINTISGATKAYTATDVPSTINDNYVFSIIKASTGYIYLGTSQSLVKYDKRNGYFEEIPELNNNLVYDIKEDSKGNIWVATFVNGVFRYNAAKEKWEHFLHSDNKSSLPYDKVLSIFEDSKKQIWLTTQGRGFCKYESAENRFVSYTTQDGMPNDVVYQIVEDDSGFFWLTTNKGLVRFDPKDKSIKTYTVASGLLSNQFNYKSSHKTKDGNIFLGCINGLISFDPNTFTENNYVAPIYITDFLLFNKPVSVDSENSPLRKSITFSDTILLRHNQNYFSLRVAALSFQTPKSSQLKYKLDGLENDWRDMPQSSLVSYSNLGSGEYRFMVKLIDAETKNVTDKTIYIQILPPFYLTWWAYFIYFVLFLTMAYILFKYIRNRQKQQQKWFVEKMEQSKEREIYDAKIRFFTNITHEIRTPLSLIKGPLENIIAEDKIKDEDTLDDLDIMQQNTNRLLDLTNQLLDFKKTEKEGFLLNLSECNITKIISEMYQRFSPLIKEYKRTFVLDLPAPDFYASIDKEAFTKIISNLFSNAIKYAELNIRASLVVNERDKTFEIRIENDGHVVPAELHEEIFKPFTRFNHPEQMDIPGTGIGMYLARTLAELHNGTLEMVGGDNTNRFSLVLPIYQKATIEMSKTSYADRQDYTPLAKVNAEQLKSSYSILIVEDSVDMQKFISKILAPQYNILMASNGEEALELLKSSIVTLVISDIMMPRMGGIELCNKIKLDINYSHIPIILLTAKTNIQSKIEGMDAGADIYMEKPFSPEYLLATVSNLISSREKLKEAFLKNPMVMANSITTTVADKEFLNKLRDTIYQNISNSDLKIEDIAESLNMSRASFYRKIKGVLDLSPNEYLRLERLKMAAQLIKEGRYQIGEICYIVGFSSSSYFSKCFQEQFGVLPKDYR